MISEFMCNDNSVFLLFLFFIKQKTAYEMRISDWSSDVCSSDLLAGIAGLVAGALSMAAGEYVSVSSQADTEAADIARETAELATQPERSGERRVGDECVITCR